MKALTGSGICLVVALIMPPAFAEELQWRAAGSKVAAEAPASPSATTPSASSSPNCVPTSAWSIGLGRPIAVAGPGASAAELPDSRPTPLTLEQPRPLVRGQAPELTVQPLPVGFPLTQDNAKENKGTTSPPPIKAPADSGFVPPMPKVLQSSPGEPYGYGGSSPVILDSGGFASLGDCGSGCFNDCANNCCPDDCCPYRGRWFYASASYLGWTFQRKNVPPLVTVSPAGTPAGTTGVLGLPTTTVLIDRSNQEDTYHSGGRFNIGIWMPGGNWAVDFDYFFLGQQNTGATFGSNGDPQFARPLIIGGQETVQFVSLPGVVNGAVSTNMSSQMWGAEINARQKWLCGPCGWVDMLYGYRHLDLSESISIGENLVQLNPVGNLGIGILDQFHTRNVFNGGQIGIQSEWHFWNRWFVGGTAKVALGDMREQVNISGSTTYTPLPNGTSTTFGTGILASGSNSGNHQMDHFVVIPELNFKIGYELNDHWRVWAGYDFLFVSNVVRPGDQIDRRLNPSQIPLPPPAGAQPLVGVAQPAVLFRTTTFIAQGVSFGLQYRW
jgi:hypothetical protein